MVRISASKFAIACLIEILLCGSTLSVWTYSYASLSASTTFINIGSVLQTSHALSLHVQGRQIVNDYNQTVLLRGVNQIRFIDSAYGDWILPNGQIIWSTWNPDAVASNFDAMKAWGVNVVRTLSTIEWWANNVGNHRQIIKDYITLAADRGI